MMAKTRSQTKLRRGRSETRAKVAFRLREGYRKPTTPSRVPRKDLFQRRIFTIKRQERAKLFVEKANQNSERYGAFGSSKWFSALLSEINEPGVVLLGNVRVWFNRHPELFQNAHIAACSRLPISKQEQDDEHGSSSSSYQISDNAETLSWTPSVEIDGHIESDIIHVVSSSSCDDSCYGADAPKNVHQFVHDEEAGRVLNIELPNCRVEEEPIIDLNRLNDYQVEDLSHLTMNAAEDEIIETESMSELLEGYTGC